MLEPGWDRDFTCAADMSEILVLKATQVTVQSFDDTPHKPTVSGSADLSSIVDKLRVCSHVEFCE